MPSHLDQIENILQELIERSSDIMPWQIHHMPLAKRLVESMQDYLVRNEKGKLIAPGYFQIMVNPQNLIEWQNQPLLLKTLTNALCDAAEQAGIEFSSQPVIRLTSHDDLLMNDIEIDASYISENSGETAVIQVDPNPVIQRELSDAYLIFEGNQIIPLSQNVTNIGRKPENHLVLDDPRVSRSHAQIRNVGGKHVLFDLNSTGGTFINGHRMTQQTLKPGDVISFAGVKIIYAQDAASSVNNKPPTGTSPIETKPGSPGSQIVK